MTCNTPCHKKCPPTIAAGTVGRVVSSAVGSGSNDLTGCTAD